MNIIALILYFYYSTWIEKEGNSYKNKDQPRLPTSSKRRGTWIFRVIVLTHIYTFSYDMLGELARWLSKHPVDLSSIPGIHAKMEEELQLPKVPMWCPTHVLCMYMPTYMSHSHKQTKICCENFNSEYMTIVWYLNLLLVLTTVKFSKINTTICHKVYA